MKYIKRDSSRQELGIKPGDIFIYDNGSEVKKLTCLRITKEGSNIKIWNNFYPDRETWLDISEIEIIGGQHGLV